MHCPHIVKNLESKKATPDRSENHVVGMVPCQMLQNGTSYSSDIIGFVRQFYHLIMAMPSPTHASQPANRPVTQPEQANFKVLWEDEMKAVNKYAHHKHVFALLLFWENKPGWTDMDTEKEVRKDASPPT